MLKDLIDQPRPVAPPDWDFGYMTECLGVWSAVGQRVSHTNQMIHSRPITRMISVHKVDFDLDCPIQPPQQISRAQPAAQQPHLLIDIGYEGGAEGGDNGAARTSYDAACFSKHSKIPFPFLGQYYSKQWKDKIKNYLSVRSTAKFLIYA
ncbi:hypothetical protein F7725_016894 [Dissostichus mawsoni]|uniref:Uncharacterized protein n=1 Tax=Dissostichus mawsoni TaxID=36200 RepID=A0A7J5Z513_DISMA|nr:hypothetical protein F7725_016892 [Dissostichus mawsoni]KAF3856170.1 hypothetical protein F7725_016893 [Dissostichus mawsoni]KAF3856171.1 hypothetical protein F7725_016894 [Dissostichus mawsoni]